MAVEGDRFDPDRLLEVLDAHRVEYVLVGGFAARMHGATRRTADLDCVPRTSLENYDRLAAALRELGARLRVAGMTDDEASGLPVVLDGQTLRKFGTTTWMTDAGPLDLLVELRDARGGRHSYEDLVTRATRHRIRSAVVLLAALDDIVESKEFADRPKDREALPELHRLQRGGGAQA
jgi:hypothetical protein